MQSHEKSRKVMRIHAKSRKVTQSHQDTCMHGIQHSHMEKYVYIAGSAMAGGNTPGATADATEDDERSRRALWGQFYRRVKAKAPAHILHEFMHGGREAKNALFRAWRENRGADWASCTLQVAKSTSKSSGRTVTRSLANKDMLLRQYCGNEEIVDRIIAQCKARGAVAPHPDLPDEELYVVWTGAEHTVSETNTEDTRMVFAYANVYFLL